MSVVWIDVYIQSSNVWMYSDKTTKGTHSGENIFSFSRLLMMIMMMTMMPVMLIISLRIVTPIRSPGILLLATTCHGFLASVNLITRGSLWEREREREIFLDIRWQAFKNSRSLLLDLEIWSRRKIRRLDAPGRTSSSRCRTFVNCC